MTATNVFTSPAANELQLELPQFFYSYYANSNDTNIDFLVKFHKIKLQFLFSFFMPNIFWCSVRIPVIIYAFKVNIRGISNNFREVSPKSPVEWFILFTKFVEIWFTAKFRTVSNKFPHYFADSGLILKFNFVTALPTVQSTHTIINNDETMAVFAKEWTRVAAVEKEWTGVVVVTVNR